MIAAASMCSGIGAPEVAAPEFDWLAACDISPFGRALFAHRFPHVEWHGDLAAIDLERSAYMGAEILIAGTPCQAFSIAGLRNSLADTRGNVTMQFVRVVHELAANGALRTVVWENVPGVLNTSDNAFGCFLGGIVGHDAPLDAPLGGWPNAGMVAGPLARLGWRVLDAQYFGLAQRRKRVFAVVDLGGGADPAAVLFEHKGVRGHSTPSRKARQDIAGTLKACAGPLSGPLVPVAYALQERAVSVGSGGPRGRGWHVQAVAMNLRGRDGGAMPEMDGKASLRAASGGSSRSYVAFNARQNPIHGALCPPLDTDGSTNAALGWAGVRRLTPRECERLQGLPDDWTLIPYRGKPAADGPRYKGIGNSMPVPVIRWLLTRIAVEATRAKDTAV